MMTYGQLRAADPAAWRTAGAAWCQLVGVVEGHAAAVSTSAAALRSGWSGGAARAADARLTGLGAELTASRPVFIEIDQLLAEYADRLARARAMLDAATGAAAGAGLLVDPQGGVSVDPAAPRPVDRATGRPAGAATEIATGIRRALDLAARADREATHGLGDLAAAIGSGRVAAPPPTPLAAGPPAGATPAAVRGWWAGLTSAQRRWLLGHEPALVGGLDGVPVAARDQANRLRLAGQRAALLARRAGLLASRPVTSAVAAELARIEGNLGGLAAVEDRLAAGTGPRAYLLALDPAGDGRAVVAVGDPDRADNVLTYVPGMTSDLPGVGGDLHRAERLAARCAELGPAERTATVLWLDYDAPDFLDEAMRASRAEDAGPALHRFQQGLRVTHEGAPAYQTVLGHSYGSLVVGGAARDHGLAADSLVFVGSPGVGVDRVAELNVSGTRVWSTTAADDIIQYAARAPGEALRGLAAGIALPGFGLPLALGRPGEQLWFGRNPSDPGFGARIFTGDPRGHVGYWDAGNPALDTMARIALGTQP